ncbi:MAG: hypothetical protein OEZ58_19550 [Gammaproteobacteria bacterium]|nr:hypothetical protein [Gammaproteobacteria bacterium]
MNRRISLILFSMMLSFYLPKTHAAFQFYYQSGSLYTQNNVGSLRRVAHYLVYDDPFFRDSNGTHLKAYMLNNKQFGLQLGRWDNFDYRLAIGIGGSYNMKEKGDLLAGNGNVSLTDRHDKNVFHGNETEAYVYLDALPNDNFQIHARASYRKTQYLADENISFTLPLDSNLNGFEVKAINTQTAGKRFTNRMVVKNNIEQTSASHLYGPSNQRQQLHKRNSIYLVNTSHVKLSSTNFDASFAWLSSKDHEIFLGHDLIAFDPDKPQLYGYSFDQIAIRQASYFSANASFDDTILINDSIKLFSSIIHINNGYDNFGNTSNKLGLAVLYHFKVTIPYMGPFNFRAGYSIAYGLNQSSATLENSQIIFALDNRRNN